MFLNMPYIIKTIIIIVHILVGILLYRVFFFEIILSIRENIKNNKHIRIKKARVFYSSSNAPVYS